MYSLFSQANVRDISTDLKFKQECAELLKNVFAELKLPPNQIQDLVDFSLNVDSPSAGSNKQLQLRQSASADLSRAATLGASPNNSHGVADATPAVGAAGVHEYLGPYVTGAMIQGWSKSLLEMSDEVDEIFKFSLGTKYTEGNWNVTVLTDFVLSLLRTHVATGKPVDCYEWIETKDLARFNSNGVGVTFMMDIMLYHLPAEIFLACAVALGDMSPNGVDLS
jgi:hypothetical protein